MNKTGLSFVFQRPSPRLLILNLVIDSVKGYGVMGGSPVVFPQIFFSRTFLLQPIRF